MHSASTDDRSFDAATLVRATADPDRWTVNVHELWTVGDKPNGGYLLALLGRAAREVGRTTDGAAIWEVIASSITYLRPPALGPADIHTTVLRRGRSATHVRAALVQEASELVVADFVVGELSADGAPRYNDIAPLAAPRPEECVRLPPSMPGGMRVGIMEVMDLRLDPTALPFAESGPIEDAPKAELRGWVRFSDGREPDALSLLFSVDAIPPATMRIGSTGWVPTLQMSTYVRAHPAPGWLGIRLTGHLVASGMVDETCTIWDGDGRVVAQATQLARLRFPDELS